MKRYGPLVFVLFIAISACVGYWLAKTAMPVADQNANRKSDVQPPSAKVVIDEDIQFGSGKRGPNGRSDDEALEAGALPGQRGLIFKDRESMERFLANLGDHVKLLGRIDALNAVHVGFSDPLDLLALLDGSEDLSLIFPAWLPSPKPGGVQAGAVGVGGDLLKVLGISSDNSLWGKGVWVAVLDTGVSTHPSISSKITMLNLVPLSADLANWNGHGTAVAGLIAGSGNLTPGVAPGLEGLLSVRIGDDNGVSNSSLIAQGIVAAVDAGVKVVNISFGSSGDSGLVRNAIQYARDAGVVIVASAGNEGVQRLTYPAANDGVIAVGAVDAMGTAMDFSNSGKSLAVMTPGYDINAAWTNNEAVSFSGTSASAPLLAGAIAAAMNPGDGTTRTAQQAADLVLSKLNEAGAPGWDPVYGNGVLDMGRVMNAGVPGIYDAALASNYLAAPTADIPYPHLQVIIQNRGTAMLLNAGVKVTTPFGSMPMNITNLAPDQTHTFNIPLPLVDWNAPGTLKFDSSVNLSGSQWDVKTANNRRVETYSPSSN